MGADAVQSSGGVTSKPIPPFSVRRTGRFIIVCGNPSSSLEDRRPPGEYNPCRKEDERRIKISSKLPTRREFDLGLLNKRKQNGPRDVLVLLCIKFCFSGKYLTNRGSLGGRDYCF